MEFAIGSQVQAEALLAVPMVVVEALPEDLHCRGNPGVGNLQVHGGGLFGQPAVNGAFQARFARTELDSPFPLQREALIGGIVHRPMLAVSIKAPSRRGLGSHGVETLVNIRQPTDRKGGAMFVHYVVVEVFHVNRRHIRRPSVLGMV